MTQWGTVTIINQRFEKASSRICATLHVSPPLRFYRFQRRQIMRTPQQRAKRKQMRRYKSTLAEFGPVLKEHENWIRTRIRLSEFK